jgi:hypothetical protein
MQRFFNGKDQLGRPKERLSPLFHGTERLVELPSRRKMITPGDASRNDLDDSIGYFHIPDSALAAKAEESPRRCPPASVSFTHPWRQLLRDMAIGLIGRLQTAGDDVHGALPRCTLSRPPLLPDSIGNVRRVDQSLPR